MTETVELLGTRHNTDESIDRVEEVIRDRRPDVVGVELPPHAFDEKPQWSVSAALDPREPVTLPGLLLKRRMVSGDDLWQVDEMFVAAQTAVDVGATVALIDRPFADSCDQGARQLLADGLNWTRFLKQEIGTHRESIAASEYRELLTEDLGKFGRWVSPYIDFARVLYDHGATNPLDAEQRQSALQQCGKDGAEASINVSRMFIPHMMQTHIDERDAQMAGHLRWLATETNNDVLGVVALGHIPGVEERLTGERVLDERRIQQPTYADPDSVRDKQSVLE